jgi:trans-aconitate 2-methyltransferase
LDAGLDAHAPRRLRLATLAAVSEPFYAADLAYVHDAGFGDFARGAAPFLLERLQEAGLDGGLVVDLGCGSGVWAAELLDAGYDVLGIDVSQAMIALAHRAVPRAPAGCVDGGGGHHVQLYVMTNATDMAPREWDASSYDALAAPMTQRGNAAVARLELRGEETVLDAGCGTGQVTETLLERLPHGHVIALDASRAMLDVARERLGGDRRVSFLRADLHEPLPLEQPLDAIVSTSTLHWVRDHDTLFPRLAAALKPGGQLVVDCGGDGNTATILDILAQLGHPEHPWTYPTVEQALGRLDAAGFVDSQARLVPRPAALDADGVEEYLRTVVLGAHVDALGPERGAELVSAVAARLPRPEIDYVRLELVARRAQGPRDGDSVPDVRRGHGIASGSR